MTKTCAFCGSMEKLTREHVFGDWVSKIGLDLTPAQHMGGPLNGLPRHMGQHPPYRQKVKDFCASCNNGWMSLLEVAAQRVLTPLILGQVGTIAPDDQGAIAMWAQKTALTAMLLSSQEQRDAGYGLPQSMYTALYERRDEQKPVDASQFWVGRYEGTPGFSAVHVTPLAVRVSGVAEPDRPHGYAITIVLGELILQGLLFTTPAFAVDVASDLGMPQLWPSIAPAQWPAGQPCTEASFLHFAGGTSLRSTVEHVTVRPWTPATQLPQSVVVGHQVQVPALCRRHAVHYPISLLEEAFNGTFYAFTAGCECPFAYLIQTESDGAHFKAVGASEGISAMYEDLLGDEVVISDQADGFICKRLPR